jgi:hypothetical protein
MEKTCEVVGDRVWHASLAGISASAPLPFTKMPVSYDVAFGGSDRHSDDESEHDAYLPNPIGRGWHKHLKSACVDGMPLPNTEEPGKSVTFPTNNYKPMAFGPIGRGWPQRARYAGTYDQQWLDEVFPFLPKDFEERYYQAAPEDQQVPLPKGPVEVVLSGFTPDGVRQFVLPYFEAPVRVFPKRGEGEDRNATLDTIMFEPDLERLSLTWRIARPLKHDVFEIAQIQVGKKGSEPWQKSERAAFPVPFAPTVLEA